jgi:hypothetical protein
VNVDGLIKMEWEIIHDLKNILLEVQLTTMERIRVANASTYDAGVLNKLVHNGESQQFNVHTLGKFIRTVETWFSCKNGNGKRHVQISKTMGLWLF